MTTHATHHHADHHGSHQRHQAGAFHFAAEHFLLLPLGALVALVWANTAAVSYFTMVYTLGFAVNQVGMALFFGLVTQEIVEATMRGGALHTWRKWTMPLAAAAGGVAGSMLVFLAFLNWRYELMGAGGWPVASAVDIAFAYMIVRSIFGRHAAVPFVLLVAVASNLPGLLVSSIEGYVVQVHPGGTALLALAIAGAALLRRAGVRALWPYVFGCGTVAWFALYLDGMHPALALVPIVPFLRHTPRSAELFEDHGPHRSPTHFEHAFEYPVHVVLFLFALVNAGVVLTEYGALTWATLIAAVVGRPAGIMLGVSLAFAAGLHLPAHLRWREIAVVAGAASIGLTFGLYLAVAGFGPGPVRDELKLGALLSGVGVPLTYLVARLLHVGRFGRHRAVHHHPHHPRLREATILVLLLVPAVAAGLPFPA